METNKFKKITRYDEYTVNEFVRELVETRNEVSNSVIYLDSRIEELKSKDIKVMTEEEKAEHKLNIAELRKEKRQVQNYLKKYEAEKERIKQKLESKKEENENKIKEQEEKIQGLEETIKQNDERMEAIDQDSEEYADLAKANTDINKQISRTRGNITRYDKKINNIIEIIGNLESENILEGLKPPKTITRAKTLNEKYKLHIEEKAKKTGYYTNARTEEENKNFKSMDELAKKLKQENEAELIQKADEEKKNTDQTKIEQIKEENSEEQHQNKELTQQELLEMLKAKQEQMRQQRKTEIQNITKISQPVTNSKKPDIKNADTEKVEMEITKPEENTDTKELSFLKRLLEKIKRLLENIIKRIENLDKKLLSSNETKTNSETSKDQELNSEKVDRTKFRENLLYKGYLKGKNAGAKDYYTPGSIRSEEQKDNFKKMDDLAKKLQEENEAELRAKMTEEETR